MKILHVIHSTNPAGGGPIEGLKQLAREILRLGHQLEVACLDDPAAPWLADFPLPVHPLGPASGSYGYTPRLLPWLRAHAAEFDLLVVNGLWQFNSFGTWLALRRTGVPYCVFTHGMLDPWFRRHYPLKHLKKWLYWPWGDYRVLRDAAAVLFTSEEERLVSRQSFWLYRCRETVVNYGTAGPLGDPAAQQALFLEKFPALRGRRLLLFLGRIHEKKGCQELLTAFQQVCASAHPGLHLVLAGPAESDYARATRALGTRLGLDDRVTWTGLLGGDLKWGAFHAAEAFILPSHQENFGISVAEALACARPVLISDRVNIWREIDRDGAGLVEPDTLPGTARLLERWLALDPAARAAMSTRALACFRQRFEIAHAARTLLEVYRQIIQTRNAEGGTRK